jgi:anti-anti-sigma factor
MHLQVIRDSATTRVILDGRLDVVGVEVVQDQFIFGVSSGPGTKVVVDCAKVTFISSLGMGMLINAAKSLRRKGQTMTLLRPQPLVEETLRMAGIHSVIPIVHDEGGLRGPVE